MDSSLPNTPNNQLVDIEFISRIKAVPHILDVICRTTGMGFAAVASVTEDRWVACSVHDEINFGLQPGDELQVETTICHEIRQHQQPVVIDNVAQDKVYSCHSTPATYGLQSYISYPIFRLDGSFFGTLCAIDPHPAPLNTPTVRRMFELYSELIGYHLDAAYELEKNKVLLQEERQIAELREQFIAILGHDLRNPVNAIANSAQILKKAELDEQMQQFVSIIQNSSYRIKELISNMLDFARARLGEGISLHIHEEHNLVETLQQVIAEQSVIFPGRHIETNFGQLGAVHCDATRIAQLFSNLLGNALTHGSSDSVIWIDAYCRHDVFHLSVTNAGEPIPDTAIGNLFTPFSRGQSRTGQQGLGLGLYIAHEIAQAHRGTLKATSTPEQTSFALEIPL
ncbi:ATP-binding protein [Arcticibacter sp.]|uniref:GAF domain-containing sensor histidine kinase n=1 Tax=Arcticibacter sp. TaxID=1872630 RepID=UPI00388F85B3